MDFDPKIVAIVVLLLVIAAIAVYFLVFDKPKKDDDKKKKNNSNNNVTFHENRHGHGGDASYGDVDASTMTAIGKAKGGELGSITALTDDDDEDGAPVTADQRINLDDQAAEAQRLTLLYGGASDTMNGLGGNVYRDSGNVEFQDPAQKHAYNYGDPMPYYDDD